MVFSNKGFEWPKATRGAFKALDGRCAKLNFNWCFNYENVFL